MLKKRGILLRFRLLHYIGACSLGIGFSGCMTGPSVHYPPTNPASIVVTTDTYNGNFQRIDLVMVGDTSIFGPRLTNEDVARSLQEKAAAIGADMVIGLHIERALSGATYGMGMAIKIIK